MNFTPSSISVLCCKHFKDACFLNRSAYDQGFAKNESRVAQMMMEHLSETCPGKENVELVNCIVEAKPPPAKLPRMERNGSPQGRARWVGTGANLAGLPYKPADHLLKTCHERGKREPDEPEDVPTTSKKTKFMLLPNH
ncbi:DNA-binding protein SATB1-like isoform X3 [Corythoichthys intestinalis]|uniref:DNA-binding protein SATB1-like isoform X3 n=1 Tax=Corythoichthys intestinalis TaxID=161448 RepID=UPI0025A63BD3|nr:DNA-binding protein SATB1-like isoform X3 [Corythoichthys intestinalis]